MNEPKRLKRQFIDLRDEKSRRLLEVFMNESDRGTAIIGVSLIEERLDSLLERRLAGVDNKSGEVFDELFAAGRPMGSLWAKARLGQLLGLIPNETLALIECMRKIRNKFAHSHAILYAGEPAMRESLHALMVASKSFDKVLQNRIADRSKKASPGAAPPIAPREVLSLATAFICGCIDGEIAE